MYSQAIAGAETDHTLFGNRSAAYLALGLYEEALQDAQKAVALNPTWAKGHYRCNPNPRPYYHSFPPMHDVHDLEGTGRP